MSGILCLKWNNHTSTFIKSLDVLRTKELYCDATIACQGKFFPVHRFVLTTCSEYFEEIFERTQCKHPFIIVKDVEELQLEALLNYMYKGEVNVLQDRLPGLIRAAEALKVKGLAVSEDSPEEKKPAKEKRKSTASSPLQPKNKRRNEERLSNAKAAKMQQESEEDDEDDEITEIENQNSISSKKNVKDSLSKEAPEISSPQDNEIDDLSFQSITESRDDAVEDTEVEDIKVEPTDIFETIEEELLPNSVESQSHDRGKEDSLFVSLLSPNNAHSMSEEDLIAMNDSNSHAMPQCSSWNDDLSNASDKTHDEMGSFDDIKIEEQELFSEPPSPYVPEEMLSIDISQKPAGTPMQCTLCSYKSKYKTNMKTHIARKHSGEQPFKCSMCKYRTSTKESLKIHTRKHTGEKPYKCELCPYRAAHYNSIKLHTNIHTTEKPYQCKKCPYRAAQKISLFKHMKLHDEGEYDI